MRSDSAVFGSVGDAGGTARSAVPNVVPGKEPTLHSFPTRTKSIRVTKETAHDGAPRRRAKTRDPHGLSLKRAQFLHFHPF